MSDTWAYGVLDRDARAACLAEARSLYPFSRIEPLRHQLQGGCSITYGIVGCSLPHSNYLLQIRPSQYSLHEEIVDAAKEVYGHYAPHIQRISSINLRLHGQADVYLVQKVEGMPYSCLQIKSPILSEMEIATQQRYVAALADFLAQSWRHSQAQRHQPACKGKVGSQIHEKIAKLATSLPSLALRCCASEVGQRLHLLKLLPVVLCHGDLIPSNIMMNKRTSSIEGVIDWAEAEYLPFGVPLYGLEHFLGFKHLATARLQFTYYECAAELRQYFWASLRGHLPELENSSWLLDAMAIARKVGILLWHGYAWDNGAINRVVNLQNDVSELSLLEAFLDIPAHESCFADPQPAGRL